VEDVLYNNGYVVKALFDDLNTMYPPLRKNYRGIGRFTSWPLDDYDDKISCVLKNEAWDKWFGFQNVFEVVPEKEFLQRYIHHCNELGLKTTILRIETPLNTQLAKDYLDVAEVLGFDLMNSVDYSFLAMDTDYLEGECAVFKKTVSVLNANGLCNSINDIYVHMKLRNQLRLQGVNLESSDWGPFPARLSIVELKD
jgi:hypothetical protein